MTDLEIIERYVTAVFPETKVKDEGDGMISFLGYTIYKEGGVYRLQKTIYIAGTYWDPPDQDFVEIDDAHSERLHEVVLHAVKMEIDELFQNVGEHIYAQEQHDLDEAELLVEG